MQWFSLMMLHQSRKGKERLQEREKNKQINATEKLKYEMNTGI